MKSKATFLPLLAIAIAASTSAPVDACAVPVFRYALERWEPDPYLVVVRHSAALTPTQRALVEQLDDASTRSDQRANVQVVVLDDLQSESAAPTAEPGQPAAGEPSADDATTPSVIGPGTAPEGSQSSSTVTAAQRTKWLEMLDKIGAPPFDPAADTPQMDLLLPLPGRPPWPVWHGPLSDANLRRLIDSPARQTIIKRILAGQSAVWAFVASGNQEADQRAEATLRKELARMEETLQLPPPEALAMEPSYRADLPVELRIGFSVVVLAKDDPIEAVFRAMVLASEPDLVGFDQPIAVPVFGRGRTYYALVGKGIHADMIEENCRFLCDGCSCMIKQENPGVDMLMAADWNALIEGTAIPDLVLPELTGIGGPAAELAAVPAAADTRSDNNTDAVTPQSVPAEAPAEAPGKQAAVTSPEDATSFVQVPSGETPPATTGQFSRRLLVWTLSGVGVAVLVLFAGSLWISKRAT